MAYTDYNLCVLNFYDISALSYYKSLIGFNIIGLGYSKGYKLLSFVLMTTRLLWESGRWLLYTD